MKVLLTLIVAFVATTASAVAQDADASLEFIVIHEKQFKNSKPIKIEDLEINGFRAEKPDLEVSKLVAVTMRPDKQKWTRMNRDGSDRVEGVDDVFRVVIRLDKKAQKEFAKLSAGTIGKRLLIRIGDRALLAPYVQSKIDTPSLEITLHDEDEAKKTVKALRKLITKSTEQGGADQPATAPESKSDGNSNAKPESKGRSQ
ncbi:MAG: hypothetical protein Q7Q71_03510 [Verrucomicrobiota bacterium JB023]|nr:hypothetical protein [Verrucomicrobiota bacterium JB023]